MAYRFSERSIKNIKTTHRILQELATRVIARSEFDFGVLDNGGLRTAEEQNKLFNEGASKCDGYNKKSFHQSGMAIDFVPYINGFTWKNKGAFLHIAKIALEEFENLQTEDYHLHWGGFWGSKDLDNDGKLNLTKELGWDLPHFELRKYPQTKGVLPIEWA